MTDTEELLVSMIKRIHRRLPKKYRWIVDDEFQQLLPGYPFGSAFKRYTKKGRVRP